MERFQNWMSYSFDDGPMRGPKLKRDSVFKLHYQPTKIKSLSYTSALYYNARMIAENFAGPFDVLLSGGIDSEVVVRIFHDLGIRQNVYVFKFENDINIRDYAHARKICDDLGIKLNVIDFNLEHWIETQAQDMFNRTHAPLVELLVRYAWLDYLDNTVVFGDGEPYWRRDAGSDYSTKSNWSVVWDEDDWSNSIYADQIGRTVIAEWYQYTPEITFSFHKLPQIQRLINDQVYGKVSSWSSRAEIHREIWPDVQDRVKFVGYEGATGQPNTRPEFMTRFTQEVMRGVTNAKFKYSLAEFESLLS